MRDEEYEPHQIPAYGEPAQPAIPARMTPHLRMTQTGSVAALLAVVCCAIALAAFPRFVGPDYTGGRSGVPWTVTALVCAAAMLAICVVQLVFWIQAMAIWRGERSGDLRPLTRLSWMLHVVSYAVVLLALWACIAASAAASWSATSAALLAVGLALMLAAQVLAAVQYVRASGPPGTIPAHMRSLIQRERQRAERLTPPQ
jgi:small-conductance mechanosensitive channel